MRRSPAETEGGIGRRAVANVLATLALFVALGGTAYAALALPGGRVGTAQLRQGAVTGTKVRPGTLSTTDLAPSPQSLPTGAAGAPGPAGPRGPVGPVGPVGLSGRTTTVVRTFVRTNIAPGT